MLQSHAKQLSIKYTTSLRKATELRPEDLGSIRLAISMALEELQDAHREQLNEMDDIIADLLEERDQLKATAASDADEILRLQTIEDQLLNNRGGATVAPPPANGKVIVTNLTTRYTGRRLNLTDDQLRTLAMDKIRQMAAELERTPTQADWAKNIKPDEPSLTSIKNRLHKSWNELIADAGLEPNLNSHQRAAQIAAEQHEEEAPADNASSTFRGD